MDRASKTRSEVKTEISMARTHSYVSNYKDCVYHTFVTCQKMMVQREPLVNPNLTPKIYSIGENSGIALPTQLQGKFFSYHPPSKEMVVRKSLLCGGHPCVHCHGQSWFTPPSLQEKLLIAPSLILKRVLIWKMNHHCI